MDAWFLTNKVILILTPQAWGNMLLAKHHYAIELAKQGNEVYFLNPPDNHNWSLSGERIQIKAFPGQSNLFIIDQQLYFPYNFKFYSRKLYNILIKKQIRDILHLISKPVDLIWSFDLGNLFPLSFFDKKLFKIFHPVDEPVNRDALLAANGGDILFSVTREIIDQYKGFGIPSFFINHGLAEEFYLKNAEQKNLNQQLNVGLSGNFLRLDMDRKILLQIIESNPEALFHFYGIHSFGDSNIGAAKDTETKLFISYLQGLKNVKLHGVLKTTDLALAINQMDALLICYDIPLDQSKGTNYHKVMEYLSTGKVIISNNITTYREYPELIRMTESRENNEKLPDLFRETIKNLDKWNSPELENKRMAFALHNTYREQLVRIESCISEILKENSNNDHKNLISSS